MAEPDREPAVRVERPNRDTAASKAIRAVVIGLLLLSAGLLIAVSIGGWERTGGARWLQVVLVALYGLFAFLVARWSRGVLPVAAALAIIVAIFAAIAAPGWYARDTPGLAETALHPALLGLLCVLLVSLQLALITFAMRGFAQAWHVEVERPTAGDRDGTAAAT